MQIKEPKKLLQQVLLLSSLPFVLLLLLVWRNISLKNAAQTPVVETGSTTESGVLWSGSSKEAQNAGIDSNAESVAATGSEEDADINIKPVEKTPVKKQVVANDESSSSSADSSLDDIVATGSSTENETWNGSASGSSAYKVSKGKTSYYNKSTGFGFDMPVSYYYANFGADAPATLRVGLKSGASPESVDSADVVVFYYPDTLVGPLEGSSAKTSADKGSDMYYVRLGKGSVVIQGYTKDKALTDSIVASLTAGSN